MKYYIILVGIFLTACYDNQASNNIGTEPRYFINLQISGLLDSTELLNVYDKLYSRNFVFANNGKVTLPLSYLSGSDYSLIVDTSVGINNNYKCSLSSTSGVFQQSDVNITITCIQSSKVFVAVGPQEQMLNSIDGVNWETVPQVLLDGISINDVLPNVFGTTYVAGSLGTINSYLDYMFFVGRNSSSVSTLNGIAVSDDLNAMIAVGDSGLIEYSTDGTSWIIQSLDLIDTTTSFKQVVFCNDRFFGVGNISESVGIIIQSVPPLGPTMVWNPTNSYNNVMLNTIECYNQKVFVGSNNGVVTIINTTQTPNTTQQITVNSQVNITQILSDDTRIVLVGNNANNGVIYTSIDDGLTWTAVQLITQLPQISSISVNIDGVYVILTTSGIYNSRDLITWNLVPNSPNNLTKVRVDLT